MAGSKTKKSAAPAGKASSEDAPVLSNSALEKLTLRIAEGVNSNGTTTKGGKQPNSNGKSRNEKGKIDRSNGKPKQHNFEQKTATEEQRGKKRDRSGSLKEQTSASKQHIRFDDDLNGVKFSKPSKPGFSKDSKDSKKSALLEEIIALGGTEEDLALVEELESDSDEEATTVQEKAGSKSASRSDIENFMKEIGLVGSIAEEQAVIEDEEVEAEEDEEWEDELGDGESGSGDEEEEEVEEESDEEMEAPAAVAPKKNTTATAVPPKEDAKKRGPLIVEPRSEWHKHDLPDLPSTCEDLNPFQIKALHERAKTLLTNDNTAYTANNLSKSANRQFLSQIMTSGTLSDKISALTLVCQESPLHNTRSFEALLNMAKKKSRSQAVSSLGALKDLLANGNVLPSDRKLKVFSKLPLASVLQLEKQGKKQLAEEYLAIFAFEDWLKTFYFEVLKVLETVAGDSGVSWTRINAIGMISELLKEKPEGEENLLRLLVNKLGDNDKKVASKTSYLLLQVQNAHPMMKPIIISSIESEVLFRPGNNQHAKYYSIITLNQTILSAKEPDVANQLLKTYFSVFAGLRHQLDEHAKKPEPKKNEKGKLSHRAKKRMEDEAKAREVEEEASSKLVSALLTGVNRAYPFSNLDDEVFQKHMDALFRITHSANFNTSIQALMLIFQVANSKQMVSDRFYRSLYESLLDPRLVISSKQALYMNLLFRALKADHQPKRVMAFAKRILQVSTMHQVPFVCGVLYLLKELESTVPSLRSMFETSEVDESDDEEVFKDVDRDDEDSDGDTAMQTTEETGNTKINKKEDDKRYDGKKRDPLHSNADRSCLWEILPLLSHFHPTVALYAHHLLENKSMPSKPDLSLHTISHFLDRFVYRNAKSADKHHALVKGGSIMQPLAGGVESSSMVLSVKSLGRTQQPVNTEAFRQRKAEDVPEDEVFFHKYFNAKPQNRKEKRKGKKQKGEDDEESELEVDDIDGEKGMGDDESEIEDEGAVWDAMVKSRPDLDPDMDEFDDDGFDEEGDLQLSEDDEDDEDEEMGDIDLDDEDEGEGEGEGGDFGMTTDDLFGAEKETRDEDDSEDEDDDDDDGGVNLDDSEVSDVDSDDEIPSDIDKELTKHIEANKSTGTKSKKSKEDEKEDRKSKRRKLKSLPLFASAEEYAALIAKGEEGEDEG